MHLLEELEAGTDLKVNSKSLQQQKGSKPKRLPFIFMQGNIILALSEHSNMFLAMYIDDSCSTSVIREGMLDGIVCSTATPFTPCLGIPMVL